MLEYLAGGGTIDDLRAEFPDLERDGAPAKIGSYFCTNPKALAKGFASNILLLGN